VFQHARTPILPDSVDVLSSLLMDAGAIDSGSFEEWARDTGYDTDSRKAESAYRACMATAVALRAALGNDTFETLRAYAHNM